MAKKADSGGLKVESGAARVPVIEPAHKAALLKYRGGHEGADDESLARLWASLPASVRADYLNPDFDPNGSQPGARGGAVVHDQLSGADGVGGGGA